jgi:hypothetical protein
MNQMLEELNVLINNIKVEKHYILQENIAPIGEKQEKNGIQLNKQNNLKTLNKFGVHYGSV